MIARRPPSGQGPLWRDELARAVRDPAELLRLLDLPQELLAPAQRAAADFPLRVPRPFLARMRRGDPQDPLLRQVLPLGAEARTVGGFVDDPVGDRAALRAQGLLHKYRGRALLVATGACAVHCRYCFRRHFPYSEASATSPRWDPALEYLSGDASVEEVILSGGDPLALSDERLAELAARLAAIPHLRRLRVHTRLPVVLPQRVEDALLDWLTGSRLRPVVVIHTNHAQEIDEAVRAALRRLSTAGVTLLNQAVLLRGVNDTPQALAALSEALFAAGVLPYYLHQLDRVHGAAHFEVDERRACALHEALAARLPGYLVPRLVREVPGAPGKTPLR
jgi:L-lysine 2,3-aminomutase